ncbi:protein of unknown function [Pararobbsia alpina]
MTVAVRILVNTVCLAWQQYFTLVSQLRCDRAERAITPRRAWANAPFATLLRSDRKGKCQRIADAVIGDMYA